MTTPVSHPLVGAYLRELDRLLHGVEPGERAEVLSGVHEHLDVSLRPGASDDDVRQTLAELGSPQSVADEAYAGRAPESVRPAPSPPVAVSAMSRSWVPVVVGLLLALAILLVVVVVGAGVTYSTSGTESMDANGVVVTTKEIQFGAPTWTLIAGLLFTGPLWVTAAILSVVSPLWTSREGWTLALLAPATALVVWSLPVLGWATTGAELGINVGAWVGLALGLIGGGALLVRLVLAGSRRATASPAGAPS